jgi:hypothetical protein
MRLTLAILASSVSKRKTNKRSWTTRKPSRMRFELAKRKRKGYVMLHIMSVEMMT